MLPIVLAEVVWDGSFTRLIPEGFAKASDTAPHPATIGRWRVLIPDSGLDRPFYQYSRGNILV